MDNNCDQQIDEGFDADGDGFTSCGVDGVLGTVDDDCAPADFDINPGEIEIQGDDIDQDCDGVGGPAADPCCVHYLYSGQSWLAGGTYVGTPFTGAPGACADSIAAAQVCDIVSPTGSTCCGNLGGMNWELSCYHEYQAQSSSCN